MQRLFYYVWGSSVDDEDDGIGSNESGAENVDGEENDDDYGNDHVATTVKENDSARDALIVAFADGAHAVVDDVDIDEEAGFTAQPSCEEADSINSRRVAADGMPEDKDADDTDVFEASKKELVPILEKDSIIQEPGEQLLEKAAVTDSDGLVTINETPDKQARNTTNMEAAEDGSSSAGENDLKSSIPNSAVETPKSPNNEQITEDLVTPPSMTSNTARHNTTTHVETSQTIINQDEEVYPKASEFLAEISLAEEESILPEQAAQIIEMFDDDRTVYTTKTVSSVRRKPLEVANQARMKENVQSKHEHQSLFDILDRNFDELGNAGIDGDDLKLCFVAFVVTFAPSVGIVKNDVNDVKESDLKEDLDDEMDNEPDERRAKLQSASVEDTLKRLFRPNIPLTVAFALWRQVLGLNPDEQYTTLSYVRSTLVLTGLLELSTIEGDDVPIPTSNINRNRREPPKTTIECLRLHQNINRQYGEYLASESFQSAIELNERRWNDAVTDEALMIGSNEYVIRMLPLNTMRAYRIQDAFDLLGDKSFVRRRVRILGASEAALAHIRDIDELLHLIDKLAAGGNGMTEPINEHEGVLGAFDQLKKYCLYITTELIKHNSSADVEEESVEDLTTATMDKTSQSKIRDVAKSLHLLGKSLGGYGFFDQEMEFYNEALRLKELCAGGKLDHVSISDTLHCMAFSFDNAGKHDEALEFYDRALDLRYEHLGDDDLRVAETLHNKGALLCDEETSEEAMECLEEALRIRELHYGEDHESCADTMQWMGNLLRQYGDPSDALDYFKFALRIKQIRLGPDHIDVANTLFNTAVLLDDVEKYDLSLIAYKEACRIRKMVLGEKHSDVADTLFCLGNVATAMKIHNEALGYFTESISIWEELIKDDDIYADDELNDSLLFISNLHSMKPELRVLYQKLSNCLEEVLPLTKLLVGSNHEDVCKLLNRMGDVYKKLHDWDNSIGSFQGALRVKRSEDDVDKDDAEVATLLQKKGEVHLYKSEFSRAKLTFDVSLQIRQKLFGRDSSAYASSLHCLGVAYHGLKDYSHSSLSFQECMRIQTKLSCNNDVCIAVSLCWLGRNHQNLNEPNKALEKFLSALQLYKRNKNVADYRIVVMLLHTIGQIYEDKKVHLMEMALKCYTEEIHLIQTKLDTNDIEMARCLALAHYKAGLLCKTKGNLNDSIEHLEQGLSSIKQLEDDSHSSTEAMIADTLGVLFMLKEDFDTAKQYFSNSYSLFEKSLGRDHETTADCAFRLAECLEHVGSNLALDFYEESLRVRRLHITEDDEMVGVLLYSIGRVHFCNNAFVDAITSFDEALNVRRRLFGETFVVAETYHQLANSHVETEELEKAIIYFKESTRITKIVGKKSAIYTVALDMANCCEAMENYHLAIECYNDCLQVTEELDDDKNIALVLQRMGDIHMNKMHNFADATKLFLDALEVLRTKSNVESSDDDGCSVLGLMFQIGQVYALAEEYENALDFYEEHIKLVESMDPINEDLVSNSLLEMGVILADMGEKSDFELAIEKLKESLDIRRKIHGNNSEQLADVLHKLAAVYEKSEEYGEAVQCLTEALRIFKMTQQISRTSDTYHSLAKMKTIAAEKSGVDSDRKAAIECYQSAINTRRQDPALDDVVLASMLYEYATLLCLDNNYVQAMPLLEEALRIQKSKKGLRDEMVANILLRTAECHVHSYKYDLSLVCLEQVVFVQDSLESCDIDIVLLNHLLGITYLERRDYEKAISTSLAALKLLRLEFDESLECADIYTNLGKAYGMVQEYDKAIESFAEALRIQKNELGKDTMEYAETVFHLAEIHVATKKNVQAINCLDASIRVFELSSDGKNALIDALEQKADCHFCLKDYKTATLTFQKCIDTIKSLNSEESNERIASLMHKMGKSNANSNDYSNAIASYRESIAMFNEILGPDNLQVANVMYDVGLLTMKGSENEKASQCYNECIRIYTLRGEQQSTKVADAYVQLGTIYADNLDYNASMESVKKAIRMYKEKIGPSSVEVGKALLLCGRLNDVSGDYDKMISNYNDSLHIFRESNETDLNVSIALSNLGVAHSRKKEYKEAIEYCKEALRIRKMHTQNDEDVADSLFNIGNLYDEWEKHQEAVPYLEGSLKLYRSLVGDEDISIANCQVKLGTIYRHSGDVEAAINSFSDALYVCEEVGEDAEEQLLIPIYKGLGECYLSEGDLESALESFASCLKIQKIELGDNCIEMASTCDSIGLIYQKSEKLDEAMQFYKKALQIHEEHYGRISPQCFALHVKICNVLIAQESYHDAIDHLHECIQLCSTEGTKSEDVAMFQHQLGIVHKKLNNHEDAINSLKTAASIRTKIYGKVDPRVSETMVDLGDALVEQDLDEALIVYDEAISILQEITGSEDSKVADIYLRMAEILSSQGKFEMSLNTMKQCLKLYDKHCGSDSLNVAKTLIHLGYLYKNLENLDKAKSCFTEGIKIFRSNPSERNADYDILMSHAMGELGRIYGRMKINDKAIELCTESLKILKQQKSKETDGSVADTCMTIADILSDVGKIQQAARFYEEALYIYEDSFGSESAEAATCHYGIAVAQKKMGDTQGALRNFGKALRIHRAEGDKTLHVANDLFRIGQIYESYGEIAKSIQCFQECLKIRQANLSADDLDLLAAKRYTDMLQKKFDI